MRSLLLALLAWSGPAFADCLVVHGGEVYLPTGRARADLVVDDGRIAEVGSPTIAVDGAKATWRDRACGAIDARGKLVTAGLIESLSQIGLAEVGAEDASTDGDAGQADPIRAAMRVADAYNPASTVIPVTRLGGITSAVITPSGGLVSGQSAWADLAGRTQAEALAKPVVAVQVRLNATASRAGDLGLLRELLDEARLYSRLRSQWQAQQLRPDGVSHLDLEALQPVLRREIPLVVAVERAADIEALLRLADEQDVRVVVAGGSEAWVVADQLAAARVPVILDPLVYGAGGFDQVQGRADNAALLARAGVPVVISSFHTHNARVLRQSAGNAVRGGLDHELALRAITATPAEVFGMTGYGRVAPGAVANLVVWSGDPLELSSRVEHVLVRGQSQALESRQTRLRDKYRKVPGVPVEALILQP